MYLNDIVVYTQHGVYTCYNAGSHEGLQSNIYNVLRIMCLCVVLVWPRLLTSVVDKHL